jgi:hypothetical protein
MDAPKKITLKEINDLYKETYYMEDDNIVPLIVSIVVGSKLEAPPVWMFLIGPSSGGKSELISVLGKIPFVHQVSDLTTNTFLSGMGGLSGDKSPSLLDRLGPNFTIVMKDFTTILTKNEEAQQGIVSQMREIYDGHIVKETGTGKKLEWGKKDKPNKATFVMAATEGIFKMQDKFSDMGTRAINYILLPQDRKKTTRWALRNSAKIERNKAIIQEMVKEFVLNKIKDKPATLDPIDEAFEDEIIDVADFCALARSNVSRDYRGQKTLALSGEFPMRMAKQMMAAAQMLQYCNDGVLTDSLKSVVFKIALDSISKQRRIVIDALAEFSMAESYAIARKSNYPQERVLEWCEDLQMFGIVEVTEVMNKPYWRLKSEYRDIIHRYRHIEEKAKVLELTEGEKLEDKKEADITIF